MLQRAQGVNDSLEVKIMTDWGMGCTCTSGYFTKTSCGSRRGYISEAASMKAGGIRRSSCKVASENSLEMALLAVVPGNLSPNGSGQSVEISVSSSTRFLSLSANCDMAASSAADIIDLDTPPQPPVFHSRRLDNALPLRRPCSGHSIALIYRPLRGSRRNTIAGYASRLAHELPTAIQ
ncbi:hypothetical protein PQX77_015895 [Marasmius sp. AFHP31]|nr:hypothetical protein PQX77_015895 [Marasmius sp. AFHP31]